MRHSLFREAFEYLGSHGTIGDMEKRAELRLRTLMQNGTHPKEICSLFPCDEHGQFVEDI
jgi:hypothetical protein